MKIKLAPSATMPPIGTVMYYGTDFASPTKREKVPMPYESIGYMSDGKPHRHISRFGRLIRVLPGKVCKLDTTPDA